MRPFSSRPPISAPPTPLSGARGSGKLVLSTILYRAATIRERSVLLLFLCAVASAQSQSPADAIWTARWVVTMDAQRRVIENGAVAIVGDHIAAVGPRAEIDRAYRPQQRLDRPDAILAPGLINTHTHAAMSLFRGIA